MSKTTPPPDSDDPGEPRSLGAEHGNCAGDSGQNADGYFAAGLGISAAEEFARQQRALDRDRLDAYARMVTAAMNVTTSVELAYRSLRAELAAALHMSEYSIERELDTAYTVTTRYPGVHEVLGAGLISMAHVSVICDAGTVIGSADDALVKHALYEEAVLAYAVDESPGRLRPIAKRLAEQFAEISLEERHEVARRTRKIEVYPSEDGMAELYAYLPAELAYAILDRMQRISKEVWRSESGEPSETPETPSRTLGEVRADTFAEILLLGSPHTDSGPGASGPAKRATPGFFAQLQVTVPVEALTPDLLPQGAPSGVRPVSELAGYGPISTRIAAEMIETARDIYRVDEARTGQVLRVERYRPTKQMRRLLSARDQRCRFPCCTRTALGCEIDHAVAWEDGGPTATDNLETLCKGHHTLKHNSAWHPDIDPSGTIAWTSPSKRTHSDKLARRTHRSKQPPAGAASTGSSPPGTAPQPARSAPPNKQSRVRFVEQGPPSEDLGKEH